MANRSIRRRVALASSLFLALLFLQVTSGQFTTAPSDVTVNETDSVAIDCVYANATSISWERDGSTLVAGGTSGYTISSTGNSSSQLAITSATPAHAGSYACIVFIEGEQMMRANFNLTVQYVGEVSVSVETEECAEGVIYEGSDVTLTCVLSPSVPPLIPSQTRWFRGVDEEITSGGSNIVVAGSRLEIQGAQSVDSQEYRCVGSNGPLTTESAGINVDVLTAFSMRTVELMYNGELVPERGEILARRGGQTTIQCVIGPPYSYDRDTAVSWLLNTGGIVSGREGFTLLTNPDRLCDYTLIITSTDDRHAGTYECRFMERRGNFITASLDLELARIYQSYSVSTTPPDTPILGENRNISFTCLADPSPQQPNVEEVISWEFRPSGSGAALSVMEEAERVTIGDRTLTIHSLRVTDSGTYVCVANHSLVEPVRTFIDLTVEAALPITISPSVPVVKLGNSLTLTCNVQSPRPSITSLSWQINGTNISPSSSSSSSSSRFTVTSDPSLSTLTISPLMLSDLTTVSCVVNDPLHPVLTSSVVVTETGQLYLVGDSTGETLNVPEEGDLVLRCPIRGRSESTSVRWFAETRELRDGVGGVTLMLDQGTGSSVAVLPGVASVAEDDRDRYICKVEDGGIQLQYQFTIYVTVPGSIVDYPPPIVNATEGTRVVLGCTAAGRPLPRITWFRGLLNFSEQNDASITAFQNGSLVFQQVAIEDSASYFCFIQNPDQSITQTTLLQVLPEKLPEPATSCGVLGMNCDETVLVFVMVGLVGFFLLMFLLLFLVICCCRLMDRFSRGKYMVSNTSAAMAGGYEGGSFKRGSLKRADNSGVLMEPPTNIFDTLRQSPEETSFKKHMEDEDSRAGGVSGAEATPHSFGGGVVMGMEMGIVGGSSSMLVDTPTSSPMRGTMVTTPSHNSVSSPLHGTAASTSIFSSDMHSVLENGLPNFPRNYVQLGELMGQGEFGPVMKGRAQNLVAGEAETEVAVKLLVTEAVEDTGFHADQAVMDYANHMKLRYKNIAAILGICSDTEPYYILYEYLDKGDLKNFLLSCRPEERGGPPRLMEHELLHMIGQVADGMAYLFSQRIVHGDIATRNCLVSSALQVKIGDLGIGHELYTGDYYDNGTQLLPIRWMPPELLVESEEGPSFSLYSDTWSFGVFCWEVMAFGRLPYENYGDEEVLAMVPAGSRLRNPCATCPQALFVVMTECWNEAPDTRPPFHKILSALANISIGDV